MGLYRKLLLAIDFAADVEKLCRHGAKMAELHGASLSLIHVVEPVITDSAFDTLPSIPVDFEDVHIQQIRDQLEQLRQRFGLSEKQVFLEIGVTKNEILRVAKEQSVDLLLLGSHGRHGIELLLGSTTNAILHHAACDVLAIHLER